MSPSLPPTPRPPAGPRPRWAGPGRARRALGLLLGLTLALAGCNRSADTSPEPSAPPARFPLRLQTDWLAQPEHGGFYQALARGFYAEAGLDVTILQGGPNAMTLHQVLQGRAEVAMNRADNLLLKIAEGMPLTIVWTVLQHDPQALLVHAQSPVQTLADLHGRAVMANPGAAWIEVVRRRYGIDFRVLPHDFGMERFLADPDFIQQGMLTNEPFYARLHGVAVRVLPVAASGYDPYHVLYVRRDFLDRHRPRLADFLRASRRGWLDYLHGDPAPADALIAARNPAMTPEFRAFVRSALRERHLVEGDPAAGESLGQLRPDRLEELGRILAQYELLPAPPAFREVADPVLAETAP